MAGLTVQDSDLLVWDESKTGLQSKLGELVQYFQVGIQNGPDGIPRSYIDPTIISPFLLNVDGPDDLSDEVVDGAKTSIDYDDGIPTVMGIPFWERLEGEAIPYFKVFKEYREMKYIKPQEEGAIASRSLAKLAEATGMTGKQLNALARAWHWQVRVKAYDRYKEVERQLIRQQNIENLECKHAKISNQLLDQAVDYLTAHPEQLSPKVAVDLAGLAMKAGRLSLGLYPDKPGVSGPSEGGRAPVVNIMNQNTQVGDNSSVQQLNMQDNMSPVERQTKENSKDVGHLQSILHVLKESGAFANALGQDKPEDAEETMVQEPIIDVDYVPVEE